MAMRYQEPSLRSSRAYRLAFEQYLRYGTPIRLEAKAEAHPATHYVWRTQDDDRVRSAHRANEGKIFAWSDPPPSGHPGEDFGCRCWAEPYFPDTGEYFEFRMLNVSDQSAKWSWLDLVKHYFAGHGDAVTVRETGHLNAIVSEYERLTIENPSKLPGQIADEARKTDGGVFRYTFGKPYQMQDVVFSIGNTTIGGTLTGHSRIVGQMLELEGHIEFYLVDAFADPLDIREFGYAQIEKIYDLVQDAQVAGVEGVRRIANYVIARMGGDATTSRVIDVVSIIWEFQQFLLREDLANASGELIFGTPYDIVDTWNATLMAKIYRGVEKSRFTA